MAGNYKRIIIQFPLDELTKFEDYSKKYSCSLSSTIVQFAIKGKGYEDAMNSFNKAVVLAEQEQKKSKKETVKKTKKNK